MNTLNTVVAMVCAALSAASFSMLFVENERRAKIAFIVIGLLFAAITITLIY